MNVQIDESKYSEYKIGEVSSFSLEGYDNKVDINKLSSAFEGQISIKGKYEKLRVAAGKVPYQVYFKIKYPKIDIPESVKIIQKIKESSDLALVGNDSGGKISVEGYDMSVTIK